MVNSISNSPYNMYKYVTKVAKPLAHSFSGRNNLCHHALVISKDKNELLGLLKQCPGRDLNAMATNTAPKEVRAKVPPRKKSLNIAETPT